MQIHPAGQAAFAAGWGKALLQARQKIEFQKAADAPENQRDGAGGNGVRQCGGRAFQRECAEAVGNVFKFKQYKDSFAVDGEK